MIRYILILLLLFLTSCAGIEKPTDVFMDYNKPPVIYLSDNIVQIRQSVKIVFGGRQFPLQGVLMADNINNSIRIVAVAGFGIKLFDIEYTNGKKGKTYINNMALKIPYFEAAINTIIEHLYMEDFSGIKEVSGHSELYKSKNWSAEIITDKDDKKQITYKNEKPPFTVYISDIEKL